MFFWITFPIVDAFQFQRDCIHAETGWLSATTWFLFPRWTIFHIYYMGSLHEAEGGSLWRQGCGVRPVPRVVWWPSCQGLRDKHLYLSSSPWIIHIPHTLSTTYANQHAHPYSTTYNRVPTLPGKPGILSLFTFSGLENAWNFVKKLATARIVTQNLELTWNL